jgi:hypothetical protein
VVWPARNIHHDYYDPQPLNNGSAWRKRSRFTPLIGTRLGLRSGRRGPLGLGAAVPATLRRHALNHEAMHARRGGVS